MSNPGKCFTSVILFFVMLVTGIGGFGCGSAEPDRVGSNRITSHTQHDAKLPAVIKRTVTKYRPSGQGITRAIAWHAKPVKGARFLTLLIPYNWCGFRGIPRTQRIDIVERTKKATVTAFVFFPKVEAPHRSFCPQTRFLGTARVALAREAFHRVLYDGSTSPPAQRWPPVREVGSR